MEDPPLFYCLACDTAFEGKFVYFTHIIISHRGIYPRSYSNHGPYFCTICKKDTKFYCLDRWWFHM